MTKARDLADLLDASGNIIAQGTIDGRDLASDGSKLDSIEHGATGDQTHSEIRALIEVGVDTNVFTDADHTKLDGIEANATADQTASEIRALVESATDSNVFTDADHTKLNAIESGATADQTKADIDALNINADTLDGQHGSYYTGYADTAVANLVDAAPGTLDTLNELAAALGDDPNFATTTATNIGTKANKTITVSAGSGLTGGGDLTANRTISHADTSSVSDVNGSGNTFIQDIGFDTYGHVTSVGTGTVTVGNGAMTVTAGSGLSGGGQLGTANQSGASSVTVSHADTSSQASVNNSSGTVIQDITLDTYGHITGIASTNLDGRYYTESEADGRFVIRDFQDGNRNLNIASNTTGSLGLFVKDSSGGFGFQLYGDGSNYGFLEGDWGAWDIQKVRNGVFKVNEGSGLQRVFNDVYHPNADKWTTARTLSLSGDASGSVSWDGSANATLSVAVADNSHNHSISTITDEHRLFNNMGDYHGARTDFNASYNFGWRYVQGTTNGPGTGGNQFYTVYAGLGDEYSTYGLQVAYPRDVADPYINIRYKENNSWGSWRKAAAGSADKWRTARTLSLSGDASGSVSWDGSANATLNVTVAAGAPAGSIIYHAGSSAPSGYVKANGASLSTSTYSALFSAIGYTYGGSGGSFNVPDLRGEFIRGWDDGRGVDSGRSFGSSQLDQMQRLTGGYNTSAEHFNVGSGSGVFNDYRIGGARNAGLGYGNATRLDFDSANSPSARVSSSTSGETRPRNRALLACIKY